MEAHAEAETASITKALDKITELGRNTEEMNKLLKKSEEDYANGIYYMDEMLNHFTFTTLPDTVQKLTSPISREDIEKKIADSKDQLRTEVKSSISELRSEIIKQVFESITRMDEATVKTDGLGIVLDDIIKRQLSSGNDIWMINQKPRSKRVGWAFASENSTIVFYDHGYEIFTHSPYFKNICSKKFYSHFTETDLNFYGISPNLKTLIYSKKSQKSTVVIFDLHNSNPFYEIAFDSEFMSITCNNNYFVVSLTEGKSFLFSVKRKIPIKEFVCTNCCPCLLLNNILAFQEYSNSLLCFYNAMTKIGMEPINVGFVFNDIVSNSTGTTVAVHKQPEGLFKMFDVESSHQIFQIKTKGLGRLFTNSISHDARFVAFRSEERFTILSLNIQDDGRRSLNFVFNFQCDDVFWRSPVFRQINGIDHFQFLTHNALKLYKSNEADKRWDLVE